MLGLSLFISIDEKNDDAKTELIRLSLLSNVCTELEKNVGIRDAVLAEFVIELGRSSETLEEFAAKLKENGSEMPDYLVRSLLNTIHGIYPKSEKKLRRDVDGDDHDDEDDTLRRSNRSGIPEASRRPLYDDDRLRSGIRSGNGSSNRRNNRSCISRWEAKQLMASGALRVEEYPLHDDYDEGEAEEELELEIEMNVDEPAILRVQTRGCSVDMFPVKVLKNPEGSLSRAAALQSALIKERREMREQQHRTLLDSIAKDLNRPWEDPMPESGERHLAQELRGVGVSAYDIPDWKKDAYGKTVTFGRRSKLSIQEQRQSLPISKLKTSLIQRNCRALSC